MIYHRLLRRRTRLSRDTATTDAAINGVVGLVVVSAGSAAASTLFVSFDPWLSAVPAFLVWCVFAYAALKQFAHGVYTLAEDATEGETGSR